MKLNKPLFPAFLLLILLPFACVPPSNEVPVDVRIDFSKKQQQKVYDYQDQGQTDSLIAYFHNQDPTLRYLAVSAFASIKDSAAVDSIVPLLNDRVEDVRIAAAYALGQIGHASAERHLINAFQRYDTAGVARNFNAAILEAVGKCGSKNSLGSLAGISTYTPKDTVLLTGQAWGIYRFALRGITSPEGTALMLKYATNHQYPAQVRFVAANYLMRARNIDLSGADNELAPAIAREEDPRVRMALTIALGKTKTEKALNALLYQFNLETDYRVRVNILRALANFDYAAVKQFMSERLKNDNIHIATTAASYFATHGIPEDGSAYWQWAKEDHPWEVKMQLYTAASKYVPLSFTESRKYLNWELKRILETSANPYEKAAALKALAANGWNYRYIRDVGFLFDNPIVRTASVEALADIARRPDFNQFFGAADRIKKELGGFFIEAIQTGDVGMVSVAANVLREPELGFRNVIDSLDVLEQVAKQLKENRANIEGYLELSKTLQYLKGEKSGTLASQIDYSHRIDWKLLNSLKPESTVALKTAKGNIVLELLPEVAPGTVANFLELIDSGFYKGKNFHRVVPNFVIQGGCTRGDGYGSLDYTIRSELPYLHYDRQGYVGMASSGNHTESQQFFITHSPTPHLDGNYTIFARVMEGMDVVHTIRIGDVIEDITIQEPK